MVLWDVLEHNARIHPGKTAFLVEGKEIRYRDLRDLARLLSADLAARGIRRGDRVALLTRDTSEFARWLFAVSRLGAVLVPLNPLCLPREHRETLHRCDARALFHSGELGETARESVRGLAASIPAIPLEVQGAGARIPEGSPLPDDPPSESDVALQVHGFAAAGRTGGAMLTHRNLLFAATCAALDMGITRHDVYLSCSPLPFVAGTGRLMRFLLVGATIVLHRDFDPERVLRAIGRDRVTRVLFTPAMISALLDVPGADRANLATLRNVLYSGSSIPLDLLKRAIRFFPCGMTQTYGQVESSGLLTFLPPEDHSLEEGSPYMRKLASVGKEATGVEIRIEKEDGAPGEIGDVGELCARGPFVFAGYHRDPVLTAEALRDGWLRTGDVAAQDEEGYLYLVDRKRDTLSVDGIPVDPREVEAALCEHPAVREAAVVGSPDYSLGEVPAAVVVSREENRPTPEELREHCRALLAPFKVPRTIDFLPRLPRNSQGKVLKAKLRERQGGMRRISA